VRHLRLRRAPRNPATAGWPAPVYANVMAACSRQAYIAFMRGGLPLGTVVKVTRRDDDPLGYEGSVIAWVCAMARDAVAGVNEVAVEEEAGVLRNRCASNRCERTMPLILDDKLPVTSTHWTRS
jgi:hypothetical protein